MTLFGMVRFYNDEYNLYCGYRLCVSIKDGIGGSGLVYVYSAALHMAAVMVDIETPWL